MRWQPGASQEELTNVPFSYPFVYQWLSPGTQEAADRLFDGMIVAALPLDVTVPKLAGALGQGGVFERVHTARTLGRFGPLAAEAVPALIAALEDDSQVMRGAVIVALGRIGPKARPAVPALSAIDGDDRLQSLAKEALKKIGGS